MLSCYTVYCINTSRYTGKNVGCIQELLLMALICFVFPVLVQSGDKRSDGARGLAGGYPDPTGYSSRWLRQCLGRLCPPLFTVSQAINESFKCMDQQKERRQKRTFLILEKSHLSPFFVIIPKSECSHHCSGEKRESRQELLCCAAEVVSGCR